MWMAQSERDTGEWLRLERGVSDSQKKKLNKTGEKT